MQIKHEMELDDSISKQLDAWRDAMRGDALPVTGFEELPPDHPDYQAVHDIRQALIAKGIDPATVYPIDFDFEGSTEPVTMVVTFDYKHFQG